jgi:hypothetical protein
VEWLDLEQEKAISVPFEVRTKVETEPRVWLRMADGPAPDLWIQEQPKVAFPRQCFDKHHYARPRPALLMPGRHVHNKFNEWGSVIDRQVRVCASPVTIALSAKAMWNGVWYFLIEPDGELPYGRWMPASSEGLILL